MKTKKQLLICFLILLFSRAGHSQPWYFNEIYNPNETWACGLSIIGSENGYFGCAISGDSVSDYFYNTSTFLLDESGEIVFWKDFGEYGYDYYPGDDGSLVKDEAGFGLFGSIVNLYNGVPKGIFYKFDQSGDTIFTRAFTSEIYNKVRGRTCSTSNNGGYILAGDATEGQNYSDIILIKLDSSGTEEWRNSYGTEMADWAKSVIQTFDQGYAVGCWTRIPSLLETADPTIIKTDSLGNFEWSLNLGGPYGDDKAMVSNTLDSCIMVLTAYADSMYTPYHAYTRINLIKIDPQGIVIWNKKYGASKPVNYISNIQTTQNGGFILCGYSMILDPSFANAGWIMEVNSAGDSLWYEDYYFYPPGSSDPFNELYDISITEDHGFIATGQAYTLFGSNQIQKMWVLKVDSVGCEIPNCWVGIEEEDKTVGREDDKKEGEDLVLWPNPARGIVDCRWSIVDGRGDMRLVIYDMFGREIRKIATPENEHEIQFSVEDFRPGLYVIVLKDGNSTIGSAKMVIAR